MSLILFPDTSRCFTLKSTPMVDWICSSKESSVKRSSMDDCHGCCVGDGVGDGNRMEA